MGNSLHVKINCIYCVTCNCIIHFETSKIKMLLLLINNNYYYIYHNIYDILTAQTEATERTNF